MTHPYFAGTGLPRVLAHRGLATPEGEESSVWENSAGAFAQAVTAGAEFIETDCQVTADGDVVLFHDDTLERLTGDQRPVSAVRTAELRALFAEHGGLMTVGEALDAFPDTRFNIDVKTDAAAEPIGALVAAHTQRLLITSFSDARRLRALDAIRRAGAAEPPATSGGRRSIVALRALSALHVVPGTALRGIDAVQIPVAQGSFRVLTPALLRAAHRHGVEVHVWTVNDPAQMRELRELGVDGIISDHADVALRTLAA
ncbi:glycerophosphodiester phosphodiesterase [Microbacterium bovistercoris]|uniref:Glycerophosphodiester phosphodiesterase n=1 Tax=Microbacterium bovistercoris TaxID=2293570 RepID=A0A371NTL2_9MICO|nr:glycerophosphodiester phosphodiesterase family protein [Microbacterium bovistercoris]REJ05530.1 glycerophosphodiester phosphodiesterase [Microbacterium bovistercoris]